MKIGELARITGASVRSLRYYEQQRLLLSPRTTGNQRVYEEWQVPDIRATWL